VIGLERERVEYAPGFRTHALVAVSSALVLIVSAFGFSDTLTPERLVSFDPSRVAAQVVSGIGFLGAGVIILRKNTVRGLTTAASIWGVAAVGLAAGGGLYLAAIAGTAFILVIQAGLRPLERRLFNRHQAHRILLRLRRDADWLAAVERALGATEVTVLGLQIRPAGGGTEYRVDLTLTARRPQAVLRLLETLKGLPGVRLAGYSRGVASTEAVERVDEEQAAG
jgi:putative Mg2+ transporter-C (MgtC) family protein